MSPKPKGKQKPKEDVRPIVHEQVTVKLCQGDKAITAVQAKEMLGFEDEAEGIKFGEEDYIHELKALFGRKIRCHHNICNRPIYGNVVRTLCQEHLRKRWWMNGEPLIVGRTNLILNGQHSLLSLILAVQEWLKDPDKWPAWKTEPVMEKLLVFGVDESDKVVNTMDTCKPRSLADVIYRSGHFANVQHKDRKQVARMLDHTVRLVWHRTGASLNAFAPRRTHSESLDFIDRHPKLLECVRHVFEENAKDAVGRYLSPGYASGLLYLMGSSKTDPTEYRSNDNPHEKQLDWANWEPACKFIVDLAGSEPKLKEVQSALGRILDNGGGSFQERCSLLSKAWLQTIANKPVTAKSLELEYHTNEDKVRNLVEFPSVGGIDYGDPSDADEPVGDIPDPKEIEQRAKQERAKKSKKAKKTKHKDTVLRHDTDKPTQEPVSKRHLSRAKSTGKFKVGKLAWVHDPNGDHWQGKIVELSGKTARLKVRQGHQGAGNLRPVAVAHLRTEQPK